MAVSDLESGWLSTSLKNVRSRSAPANRETSVTGAARSTKEGFGPGLVFFPDLGRFGTGGFEEAREGALDRDFGFARGMLINRSLWFEGTVLSFHQAR